MLKKYCAIINNNNGELIRVYVPAKSKQDVKKHIADGEIIKVTDVTEEYSLSADAISAILAENDYKQAEIDFIVKTLSITGIVE